MIIKDGYDVICDFLFRKIPAGLAWMKDFRLRRKQHKCPHKNISDWLDGKPPSRAGWKGRVCLDCGKVTEETIPKTILRLR